MIRDLSVASAVVAIALGCSGGGLSARIVRRSPAVLIVPYFTIVGDVWSSKSISAYEIDAETGNLRLVRGSPFAAGLEPAAAAVVPSGTFAYVVNKQSANISGYRLDPRTGALLQVPGSPFALADFGAESTGIAVDSLGRHVYAVSDAGISGFSIDGAKGSLSQMPGSPFGAEEGGSGTTAIALDPANEFAYVLNDFRDTLSTYAIDAGGGMKPTGTPLKVDRNGSLTIHPNGKFQYVTTNCCIDTFSIDGRSGALTPSAHLSVGVPGLDDVGGFAIDPAGKFAYAVIHKYAAAGSRIYAYSIDAATGELKTMGGRYAGAAGSDPYALTLDPTGAFAYVFNRGTPTAAITIDAYRIAAGDGRLAPLPHSPFTAAAVITDPVAAWFNSGRCPAFNGDGDGDGDAHSAPVAKRASDLVIDRPTPGYLYDSKRGFALHYPFGDAGGTITLEVSEKPPAGISRRDLGRLQTSAGIKLGSPAATLVKALGVPKIVSACNKRAYFYVTPGGMQLLREFTISHGVVTGISEERAG